MHRPPDLLDRDAEWSALERLHARDRAELVFVVGRRRIGKSFLLSRFAERAGGVYVQATRRTEAEQRAALGRALGARFGDHALASGAVLPTWESLFDYLTVSIGAEPFVLVLDEFPYLSDAAPALTSLLQHHWDHAWRSTRLRLILSGSYISAMRQLEEVDQPLYGRRTARIAFAPFTAADVSGFVPRWSARDRMRLYGLVGQLPGHLALVDPALTLAENAADLLLDPGGRLVDDAQHMLDAFVHDAAVHYSIIEAIATGDRTWSGITKRVGRTGGSVARPLQWLEEMQVVRRVVPLTEKNPARSKRAVYEVVDPYVAFWHREIARLLRAGSIGLVEPRRLWDDLVAPRVDQHMGSVFESICREWVAAGRGPFAPLRLGAWWDAQSQNEVDVVATSGEGDLLVGECKWGRVTRGDLERLRDRARLVARELDAVRAVHLVLFTGSGEADDAVRELAERGEVSLVGPEDLVG